MKWLDSLMWSYIEEAPNAAVSWYMAASYSYYYLDDPFITDSAYDELAKYILKNYKKLTHSHKKFITKDDLRCGSLQCAEKDYPTIVKCVANRLNERLQKRRKKHAAKNGGRRSGSRKKKKASGK